MRNTIMAIILGALAGLSAACSEPPTQAIEAAEASLDAADAADAAQYAAEPYDSARAAREMLQSELAAQEAKFSLLRSYERATELAVKAAAAADEAEQEANVQKGRIRDETAELIADARALVNETKILLAEAPRGKGTEPDLAALHLDLTQVEMDLQDADDRFGAEAYLEAKDHAEAARQIALRVKTSVENAMIATRRRG